MKLKSLLFLAATAACLQSSAQSAWVTDSISMGGVVPGPPGPIPSYNNDVYYSMKNDSVKADSNFKWHLAFQMLTPAGPNSNVSILANTNNGKVSVFSLHLSATAKFGQLTPADTAGKVSPAMALYNSDTSWNYGAFNQMADPSNPFDFSWGSYDMTSHNVVGDSLYLIKIGNAAYQLWLMEYKSNPGDSIQYNFRVAKFDGTDDNFVRIYRKNGFTDNNFGYYDVLNNMIIDREPDNKAWDIVFTRSNEPMSQGPATIWYPVTTVLSNFDVEVAEVKDLNPDASQYLTFNYDSKINVIGSDWKKLINQMTGEYAVNDTLNYFIKTKDEAYYQLKFTRFDGSSTGKVVFQKRLLAFPAAVNDVASGVNTLGIVPNPAANDANIVVDAKASGNATVVVIDMMGRVMQHNQVNLAKGLNAFRINTSNFVTGTYFVTVSNGNWKIADKLSVQH